MNYDTSWWEICGETDWTDTPSGGRMKSTLFRPLGTQDAPVTYELLPIGALWAVDRGNRTEDDQWPRAAPHDHKAIACKLIDYTWYIEWRASNCTKKDDNTHRCWVRQGTVGEKLTVDKKGNTCGAGAGSFYMDGGKWHGFLRNGQLVLS